MAKDKPTYEVNEEFNEMAQKIVDKYPEHFSGIVMSEVCCVNITNPEKPKTKSQLWALKAVAQPMRMHCPYGWYVILYSSDWDEMGEPTKLLLAAEILHGIPRDESDEGKVTAFDTKGFASMYRTLGGIDYMDDAEVPHILETEIKWK